MALRIVPEGGANHALADETGTVGWLRDDTVGFRGFLHEWAALKGAALAHAMVAEALVPEPSRGHPPSMRRFGPVTWTVNDACYAGDEQVGRFLRPLAIPVVGQDSFGFELSLRDISPGLRQSLVHRIHGALAALRVSEVAEDSSEISSCQRDDDS